VITTDADYSFCRLQNVMIKVTVYKLPGHDETCSTFSRYMYLITRGHHSTHPQRFYWVCDLQQISSITIDNFEPKSAAATLYKAKAKSSVGGWNKKFHPKSPKNSTLWGFESAQHLLMATDLNENKANSLQLASSHASMKSWISKLQHFITFEIALE